LNRRRNNSVFVFHHGGYGWSRGKQQLSVGHKKVLLGPSGANPSDIGCGGNVADAFVHVELALYDHFHNPDVVGARAFYASVDTQNRPLMDI
jgi:hypothetical protein